MSLKLILVMHAALLEGVRGHDQGRGRIRTAQVWIGPPGAPMQEARFVPPAGYDLQPALNNWETYLQSDQPDLLVQLAILHAGFEIIHPFLDGNGRLGRLIIPLFLNDRGLLSQPVFFLSRYLERNRQMYYDALLAITEQGAWTAWVRFFLQGLIEEGQRSLETVVQIRDLRDSLQTEALSVSRSPYILPAIDFIFRRPIFSVRALAASEAMHERTARRVVNSLLEMDILTEVRPGKGTQGALYRFQELLHLVDPE